MPRDNRKILNAVRGPNKQLFKDGMEDELAAAASQERLEQLKRDGVISGDWTSSQGAITVSGDTPSKELQNRANAEGIEITGTLETSNFEPLSVEETVERMNDFDFSADVTRSMTFHGDAIKEEILKRQANASADENANAGKVEQSFGSGDGEKLEEEEFPANFPARSKFIKLDKTLAEVKAMTREKLIELDGIAEITADEVLAYLAEAAK